MDGKTLATAEFEEEKDFKLPKGAEIIKKSETVSVRKIRNGYVLRISYDIKWKSKDSNSGTQYEYFTHEWFSVDNPMTITIPKEASLADKLG